MKQLIDFFGDGIQKIMAYSRPPVCLEDEILQVAFCWTDDLPVARRLVSSVLADCINVPYGTNSEYRVLIYSSLYHHWSCFAEPILNEFADSTGGHELSLESELFHQCIVCLPGFQRVAVTLVDIAELSYAEISYITDMPESRVSVAVTQARTFILRQVAATTGATRLCL